MTIFLEPLDFVWRCLDSGNTNTVISTSEEQEEGITEDVKQELEASVRHLDGIDACVFLAVKNVDIVSNPSFLDDTTNLKEQVENAIQTLPKEINNYREINTLTWMRLYNSSKKGIWFGIDTM